MAAERLEPIYLTDQERTLIWMALMAYRVPDDLPDEERDQQESLREFLADKFE